MNRNAAGSPRTGPGRRAPRQMQPLIRSLANLAQSASAGAHMTRTTNARLAGFTFLFYIAAGMSSMTLLGRATSGEGIAAKLATVARHATDVGIVSVLSLLTTLSALVLAVTLYAITREQDPDLAMLGLTCRVGEGLVGMAIPTSLVLLWLATATGADAPNAASAHAIGLLLLKLDGWTFLISGSLFAVGSTLFSWLLLRGRMIPVALAWLGVLTSILVVIALPLQLAGVHLGAISRLMWLPMLAFEVSLALWFLIKGVAAPAAR
jgi:hypothetical protein